MYALPRALGAGTLVVITICTIKCVCTLCWVHTTTTHATTMPQNPLPHLVIGSQYLTIIRHLNLYQCCERPRWSWSYIASCRTLSLTFRTTQHKACSQVVDLFVWDFFVVVFVGLFFFFLNRWDQTQFLSVSDFLRTLRLLTFSLFSLYIAGHLLG